MGSVRGVDAVTDRFQLALDDGQGGPQLVADVGHERPTPRVAGSQLLAHLVEGTGEQSLLSGSGLGHARGVVALLDASRCSHQRLERQICPSPAGTPVDQEQDPDDGEAHQQHGTAAHPGPGDQDPVQQQRTRDQQHGEPAAHP